MLKGEVTLPGDKSISHRALMLGSLAEGVTEITGFLPGNDCLATMNCLKKLGVKITEISATHLLVHGKGTRGFNQLGSMLDCGNSGTTARLLTGLLAALPFEASLTGDSSLKRRPMDRVVIPLMSMGAFITAEHGKGWFLPLTVRGRQLNPLNYRLPVASAQVKSALLLAGLAAGVEVVITEPARSRDHTERMIASLGGSIAGEGERITLAPGQTLHGRAISVPGDISAAAFFLVAASIVPGSELIIKNVGLNPTRTGVLDVLQAMGADITLGNNKESGGEPVADILVKGKRLKGTLIEGDLIPRSIDEIPVLAVAAALAAGETWIKDAGELRVKETDRIKAVAAELKRIGAQVEELPDGLFINGVPQLKGGKVKTYGDHRMAMALQVAGLAAREGISLDNKACVQVSFPDFFSAFKAIGGNFEEV